MYNQDSENYESPAECNHRIIRVPLGDSGLVSINITLDTNKYEEISLILVQLLSKQLNIGIVDWLQNYAEKFNMQKEIRTIFEIMGSFQVQNTPIVSPLDVFSRQEKGMG